MSYQVFTERPDTFSDAQSAAGCFCEFQDKILLLKRHPHKFQGNTWCIPGGKAEFGEEPKMTVVREIKEEIGLNLADSQLEKMGILYFRFSIADFVFQMFCYHLLKDPTLHLNLSEHIEFKWVTISEALQLPLMLGEMDILKCYQDFKKKKS